MALHAIRLTVSVDDGTPLRNDPDDRRRALATLIDGVVDRASRTWEERRVPPAVAWTKEDEQGEQLLWATFRVPDTVVDERTLVAALETQLTLFAAWHRIEYHACDLELNRSARTGCPPWRLAAEGGSVPTDQEMWR